MKRIYAILFASLCVYSCKKDSLTFDAEKVNVFYRLAIRDLDDQVSYSRVVSTKASLELSTTNPSNGGHGEGEDNSQGQEHYDGDKCNPNAIDFCYKHPWHKKCKLLPIKLDYIGVKADGNKVKVAWKVSLEENVLSYDVERSMDAINFKVVGSVSPTGVSTDYEFVDLIK